VCGVGGFVIAVQEGFDIPVHADAEEGFTMGRHGATSKSINNRNDFDMKPARTSKYQAP
jgi:hypothetical protein